MTCSNANINPSDYILPDVGGSDNIGGIVGTPPPAQGKRRRRRRNASSAYVKGRRLKRQAAGMAADPLAVTTNRTIVRYV